MNSRLVIILVCLVISAFLCCSRALAEVAGLMRGTPKIQSISELAFGPEGVLFVGDARGGAVFALDLGDTKPRGKSDPVNVQDVEARIAARLGTKASEIMVHDLAVNPISQNVYLSVSRGRGKWTLDSQLPNHVADADILLRIPADGNGESIDVISLANVRYARKEIPDPIGADKMHPWLKGISRRTDSISDMAYADGTLYVAGLSNEEFASTMWTMPFPFRNDVTTTTLEIYHGSHGQFETEAPIRAFVPYELDGRSELLAAYLCTPLVVFRTADLQNGKHIKGRTVGEFGFGNYPLDMVVYRKDGKDKLLIANSNLPFMIVDPKDLEAYHGSITSPVKGYLAGVPYEPRSGTGILQMDRLNDKFILTLRRLPAGDLKLQSLPVDRF
jgi:hypothetical protein